jgi:hypothetical protein
VRVEQEGYGRFEGQATVVCHELIIAARSGDGHLPTCPLCAPWNGVVVSLGEPDEIAPHTLAEAEAAWLYHPNCLHSHSLWLPEFSDHAPNEPDIEGAAERNERAAEETKALALRQREEEREKRRERRRAERESLKGLSSGKGDTDGFSVIREKEPFDIEDGKAVEEAFRKFAEETAGVPIEKAVVISPDGYKYDVDGVSGNVGIHLVGDGALKGAKVIHNHPGIDADSFSAYDFSAFFEHGLDTLEVVYNGKRHRVRWTGERLTKEEARSAYDEGLYAIREEAFKSGIPIENTQYSIMRYLQKKLKGLIFHDV